MKHGSRLFVNAGFFVAALPRPPSQGHHRSSNVWLFLE